MDMKKYFKQYIEAVTNPLPEMADYFDLENHYLKDLVSIKKDALDVGCGNGRNMKFLAPYCKEIVGIDYDRRMIAAAKRNLEGVKNAKFLQANFFTRRFPHNYDLVFASYNLLGSSEMLVDQGLSVLRRMVKFTKPGGRTVAAVWSDTGINFARKYYTSIGITVDTIKGNNVITDFGIFRRFTRNELHKMAKGLGKSHKVLSLTPLFYILDIEV